LENQARVIQLAASLANEVDSESAQQAVRQLISALGEDPQREGLIETPDRVVKSLQELLSGYREDPVSLINGALFHESLSDMVVVRDIEFYSLCEHHLLPFFGRAHIAYIPDGTIVGLSKIPRVVDLFARRLQVQERMTRQIAEFLDQVLQPKGVAVIVEALHLCSMMRGVKKHDARLTTTLMLGMFQENETQRLEFLEIIGRGAEPLHL
jgi:GTP cyclohydrolase I